LVIQPYCMKSPLFRITFVALLLLTASCKKKTARDYYDSANAKYYAEDKSGALEDVSKAVELQPKFLNAYVLKAKVELALYQFGAAKLDCQKAISLDPEGEEACYILAETAKETGDHRGEINAYSMIIAIEPDSAINYSTRATLRQKAGDLKGALQDFNKCIQLKPKDGSFYYWRGMVKVDANDTDGACEDFHKAKAMGDISADAAISLNCGGV
jgi:tetratricopeptide (TPR) repeat protein